MFSFDFFRLRRGKRRWQGILLLTAMLLTASLLAPAAFPAAGQAAAPDGVAGGEAVSPREAGPRAQERFLAAAEKLYEAVHQGGGPSVSKTVAEVESGLKDLPMKEIATAEGIQALARNVTDLKRASASVKADREKLRSLSASLRLAADALAHPDKPIWLRYSSVMREDLALLERELPANGSITGPAPASVLRRFEELADRYRLIRTAAALRSEPWMIELGDSAFRYAERIYRADSPSAELLRGTIPPLKETLEALFPSGEGTPESAAIVPPVGATPPSWGWSAMMGTFIVTILTWVGWRRYRYEEATGRTRKK